ncbi:hypothetical protein F5Y13DRAFT_178693 [Hypoxylon sp. FL1857]|nr:hypothetical protein F5Y13DRAFT_178693 [Hypoxylon sp. FL1857]
MASPVKKELPLPREIVLKICEALYRAHHSSLVNFALSNKANYDIATVYLYRTIRIFGDYTETLALGLRGYASRLHRDKAFQHVRHLVVFGLNPMNTHRSRRLLPPMRDLDFECRFKNLGPIVSNSSSTRPTYENDQDWQPLAVLIKQLTNLTDLIYHRPNLVPPCLLQALHEKHPRCRLHIDDFKLYSLAPKPPILDPYELMVVTSPCLYSIYLSIEPDSLDSSPVHILIAIQRIVAKLAPNLKEVRLLNLDARGWGNHSSHPVWEHLDIAQSHQGASGSLSCLQFQLNRLSNGLPRKALALPGQFLTNWSLHTDFSVLQTLKIGISMSQDALKILASAPHGFPSLRTLGLILKDGVHQQTESPSQYYELASQFISGLRGLRNLDIASRLHRIDLGTILGPELRTLVLRSPRGEHPTARDVAQIREKCPFLTELTLTVLRSQGDANEAAIYRELGRLPKLQQLCLRMDALPPPEVMTGYLSLNLFHDRVDQEPGRASCSNGHLRDVLINGAMDKSLALDIFRAISRAKPANNSIPLDRLDIRFLIWPGFDSHTYLGKYRHALRRPWKVERGLRDDSRQSLVAQGLFKRPSWEIMAVEDHLPRRFIDTIFDRIWPKRPGLHWSETWYSFPLSDPHPPTASTQLRTT